MPERSIAGRAVRDAAAAGLAVEVNAEVEDDGAEEEKRREESEGAAARGVKRKAGPRAAGRTAADATAALRATATERNRNDMVGGVMLMTSAHLNMDFFD
jgi:hypothetical protein